MISWASETRNGFGKGRTIYNISICMWGNDEDFSNDLTDTIILSTCMSEIVCVCVFQFEHTFQFNEIWANWIVHLLLLTIKCYSIRFGSNKKWIYRQFWYTFTHSLSLVMHADAKIKANSIRSMTLKWRLMLGNDLFYDFKFTELNECGGRHNSNNVLISFFSRFSFKF